VITQVRLKNWRSHADTELKFSEGTNCFVGMMGTGKTSILDSICFAFFGTFPHLQQKKIKLEDILMKKPSPKEQAEVVVNFETGDSDWSIKRTVAKGRSSAELRKGGELIEGPQPIKVNEEIKKILKMDYDLFTRAIYSEQNQLDMFLTIPKGQRLKKIDELLAIDKFEKARVNTSSLINRCKMVINERNKFVQSLETDETLKRLDIFRKELADLHTKEIEMKAQTKQVKNRREKLENDMSKLKEQEKRLNTIEEENKKYSALIEITEKDIEDLKTSLVEFAEDTTEQLQTEGEKLSKDIEVLDKNYEDENKHLELLRESHADMNASIKINEERIEDLKMEIEEGNKILLQIKKTPVEKLEKELEKENKALENKQLKYQKTQAKISEIEESITELSKVTGGNCPICGTKLTEAHKESLISKREKSIGDLKEELKIIEPEIKQVQKEIKSMEDKIRKLESLEMKVEDIVDKKKELKNFEDELLDFKLKNKEVSNEKSMLEKNLELIQKNLKNLKERHDRIIAIVKTKEEVDLKMRRLKDYKFNLNKLAVEKESLAGFSSFILERLNQEYRAIIKLEAELEANLGNLLTNYADKQKFIEELEKKKKTLEDYKTEIRRIDGISQQFELLESALTMTQEQLRKDFVSAVNSAMQAIWSDLYPYKDYYSIRLGIEEGDYVLQLQDSTGWIPVDGIASGGERSMAALALRMAFSFVLAPQLLMLFLDEPTENLDSQAIEELAKVLRERISNLVEQCFLVTHDERLKEAVTGYCYVFERDKSRDGETKVSLVSSPLQF